MALQTRLQLITTTLPSLLLLLLFAWSPLPVPAGSSPVTQLAKETVCRGVLPTSSDVHIPYPFGIPNVSDYLPGFQVSCVNEDKGFVAKLSAGNNVSLRITNISADEGYVRVLMDPFYFWTYRSTVKSMISFSLEGTPYTFSGARNTFTAVGCDSMIIVSDHKDDYTSGCVAFCTTPMNAIDVICSGVGCCQTSLRGRGMKRIDLNVTSMRRIAEMSNSTSSSCAEAFLVEQDGGGFKFNKKQLLMDQCFRKPRPVVLDWAIGNKTCEQATHGRSAMDDYACKVNTNCYNSPTKVGYLCKCKKGYSGNPYVGCSDKDECRDPKGHPCLGKCVNTPGSFHCPCPLGHRGDGRRDGVGCERPTLFEVALGVGLGLLVLLLAGGIITYWEMRRRRGAKMKQRHFMRNGGFLLHQNISAMDASTKIFTIDEIKSATNNFSAANVVGQGGYGTVYRGVLSDRSTVVAIKKSKFMDESQVEQFVNEVVILSKVHHPNVVRLLGCCLESQVPLLVYEFVPNGALFDHVHNASAVAHMTWEYRLRVLEETAQALAHLHTASPIPVIHRDVKSCNILLDKDYRAKVSDFGASRLVPFDQTHITTVVQGTLGYLDPEYFHTSQLTDKSDVYSFGVVIVELLTSEKPVSFNRAERNLASHFLMLLEENRLMEVVDYRITREAGALHVFEVAQLAKACLSLRGEDRPAMSEVAVVLRALRKLMTLHHSEKDMDAVEFPLGKPLDAEKMIIDHHPKRAYTEESSLLS